VLVDLAGYFALPTEACTGACVYTWGPNADGEQANGSTYAIPHQPAVAYGLSGVVTAVEDDHHVCALTSDGLVWDWGDDIDGRLGRGGFGGDHSVFATQIPVLTGATALGYGGIAVANP